MTNGKLHQKARDLIQAGALPNRQPDRTWGQLNLDGQHQCALCELTLQPGDAVLEAEFTGWDGKYPPYLHLPCFVAFESELRALQAEGSIVPQSEGAVSHEG